MSSRWRIAVGVAATAALALAIGVAVWLTTGGAQTDTTVTQAGSQSTSHTAYVKLWASTQIGASMPGVLARWPKPYQRYVDNFQDRCFEWRDNPGFLYNLCFKEGVLATKDTL